MTTPNDAANELVMPRRELPRRAAADHGGRDAHDAAVGGGTLSRNLGQLACDAQYHSAEIAAAGHARADAQGLAAGGGTYQTNLGQSRNDARAIVAEIAAADHIPDDAQSCAVGGGTYTKDLGHLQGDIPKSLAEIAAAGQSCADAQGLRAGGGTLSTDYDAAMAGMMPRSTMPRRPPSAFKELMPNATVLAAAPFHKRRGPLAVDAHVPDAASAGADHRSSDAHQSRVGASTSRKWNGVRRGP
jgi:hypothetical protein